MKPRRTQQLKAAGRHRRLARAPVRLRQCPPAKRRLLAASAACLRRRRRWGGAGVYGAHSRSSSGSSRSGGRRGAGCAQHREGREEAGVDARAGQNLLEEKVRGKGQGKKTQDLKRK